MNGFKAIIVTETLSSDSDYLSFSCNLDQKLGQLPLCFNSLKWWPLIALCLTLAMRQLSKVRKVIWERQWYSLVRKSITLWSSKVCSTFFKYELMDATHVVLRGWNVRLSITRLVMSTSSLLFSRGYHQLHGAARPFRAGEKRTIGSSWMPSGCLMARYTHTGLNNSTGSWAIDLV